MTPRAHNPHHIYILLEFSFLHHVPPGVDYTLCCDAGIALEATFLIFFQIWQMNF